MAKTKSSDPVIVTRSQMGQLLGCSGDHVGKLIRDGMPGVLTVGHGRGHETTIDAIAAMAWWREMHDARTRKDRSIAEWNELRVAERKRELLPAEQVIADGQAVLATVRARLRALGRRMLQDGVIPHAGVPAVDRLVEEALSELARWKPEGDDVR